MKKIMQKGFTLVELLIVIALLGALAIGLIGALDPFEQLKKGTDTGVRNTVSEFHSAVIRYYALKGYMPWCPDSTCATQTPDTSSGILLSAIQTDVISKIIQTGELKTNFTTIQSAQLGKIYVTGAVQDVTVCYNPESKSFQADKNTNFIEKTGVTQDTTNACKGNGGNTNCYWCVK
jgi:prepilin-type N-terminal cleavage/methylation domain-containing protein